MSQRRQRKPGLRITRIVPVSICLCAFILFPTLQVTALAGPESSETACHYKEDGETSEKELVDWFSTHRRSNNRPHQGLNRLSGNRIHPQRVLATANRVSANVGHQLANGLCAPLLI